LSDDGVRVAGSSMLEGRVRRGWLCVAQRDRRVARQAAASGAFDRRAAKGLAECGVVHLEYALQVEVGTVAGLELRPAAWSTTRRGVVGTHLLADVAAEDPFADLRPKRLGDRATVLDREIRDAAFSGQMVGLVQRVGGAGVDAQPARATVPRDRGVKLQLHVG